MLVCIYILPCVCYTLVPKYAVHPEMLMYIDMVHVRDEQLPGWMSHSLSAVKSIKIVNKDT